MVMPCHVANELFTSSKFMQMHIKNKKSRFAYELTIQRDFTYIDDVVDNTLSLLQDLILRDESFSDIVNIGGGRPLDMNYLIGLISKKGSNNLDLIKANESKYDSRITMADNSYLKSILGDLKFTDLEQGVERLMSWASQENIKPPLGEWSQSSV
jgi:UDP-glucuronate 4-epimerase